MTKYVELEQLAARIDQSRKDRMELHDIKCEFLGGTVQVTKLPMHKMLDLLDSVDETGGRLLSASYELNKEIVYMHCPVMHKPELLNGDDIVEPYDVVGLIFNDNLEELDKFTTQIMALYGLNEDYFDNAVDDVKNS